MFGFSPEDFEYLAINSLIWCHLSIKNLRHVSKVLGKPDARGHMMIVTS